MRQYILQFTLLFGPLVLFFLWVWLTSAGKRARAAGRAGWRSVAYAFAFGAVLNLLVIVAIVISGQTRGGGRDQVYIPPNTNEDGQIVPGRFVPAEEAGEQDAPAPAEEAPS